MAHEHIGAGLAREEVVELCLDEFLTELPSDPEVVASAPDLPPSNTHVRALRPPPPSERRSIRHVAQPSRPAPVAPAVDDRTRHLLPREGEVIGGKYEVERVLGHTGNEVVCRARHLELGLSVIVRSMTRESALVVGAVRRFQVAAQTALRLHSNQAERVVDFGRLGDGTAYRVAALPRGPSLAEFLRMREALPVSEAVDLLLSLCQAVNEAHAAGLVYASLASRNLFVERGAEHSPRLCFLDFGGIESELQPQTADSVGSDERCVDGDYGRQEPRFDLALPAVASSLRALPYLAPEQLSSAASVDHRADIWALGALLWEMVAGRPAFAGVTEAELRAKITTAEVADLRAVRCDVPAALAATVHACLQAEPWLRPQSVNDLTAMLVLFSSSRPLRNSDASVARASAAEHAAMLITSLPAPITLVGHPAPLTIFSAPGASYTRRPAGVSARTPTYYSLLSPSSCRAETSFARAYAESSSLSHRLVPLLTQGIESVPHLAFDARAGRADKRRQTQGRWPSLVVFGSVAVATIAASVMAAVGTSRLLQRPIASAPQLAPIAVQLVPSEADVLQSAQAAAQGLQTAAHASQAAAQAVAGQRAVPPTRAAFAAGPHPPQNDEPTHDASVADRSQTEPSLRVESTAGVHNASVRSRAALLFGGID